MWQNLTLSEASGSLGDLGTFLPLTVLSTPEVLALPFAYLSTGDGLDDQASWCFCRLRSLSQTAWISAPR